jgi:NADP-dependent 3-hydroxy acid dehydrogenase YdfG
MTPRTALVTGSTSGIGLAVAEAFGALGWRVAVGARRADRLDDAVAAVERAGGRGFGAPLDICDPDSIDAFVSDAEKALGPIDVLVNNAGGMKPGRLHELPVETIRESIETNLLGGLYVTRRVLRGLVPRGSGGDLVFISSRAAVLPWPRNGHYGAAKAGLENVANALRVELEGTGIRSTIVRVGDTVTQFGASWGPTEFAHVGYWAQIGLVKGGILQPANVAAAVVAAVTAPPGVQLETIVVNPEPPRAQPEEDA